MKNTIMIEYFSCLNFNLFLAGRLSDNMGMFAQITYTFIAKYQGDIWISKDYLKRKIVFVDVT